MKNPMILPQIRIKNSFLLFETVTPDLHTVRSPKFGNQPLPSWEDCEKRAEKYRLAWRKDELETKVLTAMQELLNVSFKKNIIDVYLAPWFRPISDPIIIGFNHTPSEFVDTLTHELLHGILTDNNKTNKDTNMRKTWATLFGGQHSFDCLVHIPVHAMHKAIYLDVLKSPKRMERDMQKVAQWEGYRLAWEYVDKHGHQRIIEQLKASYQKL